MQTVYFFDKPIIGYCPECDEIAVWDSANGLHCPNCKSDELSEFEYEGKRPYPE